jgi:hypothetical protein
MPDSTPYWESIQIERSAVRVRPGSMLAGFVNGDFYAEYETDFDMTSLDESAAAIPFVLATAGIVLCSGERVAVDRLDLGLTEALDGMRSALREMYPTVGWDGVVDVRETVPHAARGGPAGMVFGGGIDSTHTLLTEPDPKVLFTVWGFDTDPDEPVPWGDVRDHVNGIAERFGHVPVFVRSNFFRFLDFPRLHSWHREIVSWNGQVQHGPALVGLTAPTMLLGGGGEVIISATHTRDFGVDWGSSPLLDESVRFGDLQVRHAGYEKTRQAKLGEIVAVRRERSLGDLVLRVCHHPSEGIPNCGTCEKCLRSATGLIVEGEDPRAWGLPLDPESTLKLVKRKLTQNRLEFTRTMLYFWKDVQERARTVEVDGSLMPYVSWFAGRDLDQQYSRFMLLSGRRLYDRSPGWMRRLIRTAYVAARRLR